MEPLEISSKGIPDAFFLSFSFLFLPYCSRSSYKLKQSSEGRAARSLAILIEKYSNSSFINCIYVVAGNTPAAISEAGKLGTLSKHSSEQLGAFSAQRHACTRSSAFVQMLLFSQPLPELSVPRRAERLLKLHHGEPVQTLLCHLKHDLTRYHSTDHPHAAKAEENGRQGIYSLPGCEC